MTTRLCSDLAFALSELAGAFGDDPEKLHLAVAVVFSAIFRACDVHLIIVGGQAAAHWLRAPGSRDTDFACTDDQAVRDDLLTIGFAPADMRFRLLHPTSRVEVEEVLGTAPP